MNIKQPFKNDPSQPRRPIERDYLAVLADMVTLEAWRDICQKTVEDARAGDAKARDWLARYLIGPEPMKLLALAAEETGGISAEDLVAQERDSRLNDRILYSLMGNGER